MINVLKNRKYILLLCLLFSAACATTTKNPNITPSSVYNAKGEMLFKTGKYTKAEKYFNKSIAVNPYNLEAYKNRGSLYYAMGNLERALKDFDYVLSYEPKDSSTLSAKGAVLAGLGNYDEAYKSLYESLKLNPSNIAALNSLGGLLYTAGDFERAKQVYSISLDYKTSPEIYYMRAQCYAQLGDTENANKDYSLATILQYGTGNTAPTETSKK